MIVIICIAYGLIAGGSFVPLVRWRVRAFREQYRFLDEEYGFPAFEAGVMSLFWPIALMLWPISVGGRKLVKFIVESEHREKKVKQS